ncbi:putative ABC transport system ATP-binding protein [Thermosporothrix hazakensis]|jgi:putative ABC transport system ATP-binding protein|uniref:ABC transporter ATP-binding protein n=2 Tax=Thermosporothrix TaxID=768650 RepID=A0A455SU83_9CHLR|nr:ABC transporter ATP-binding protein [Thermosporothrix hazakensis]PZW26349.1 putative ABC transport system ATP-binding protein [Thermosporothrix hazakensis]BBH90649.1 ABC transporter ATP-binding protein [Thermosporothrix sp. COM3]GCE48700.1 ABC transporter ATP-binding protein [Thermosporothrix hazakensis]
MTAETARALVEAHAITRDYPSGGGIVHALRGIDLIIQAGEFVALRGRSGSGKTTLINILIGIDNPTTGDVFVLGHHLKELNENERARLRRESIGIMFQNAHLFPALTALENVELPLRLARTPGKERIRLAREALEHVGLGKRWNHRGLELSGGEQQRVALARALVHKPRFIVADEPTGNLDSLTGRDIAQLLRDISHTEKIGMLIATHDPIIYNSADRVLQINDGLIAEHQNKTTGDPQQSRFQMRT